MADIERLSKAEAIKQQSRQLRGNLAHDLADVTAPFDGVGYSLLKFHGIYQGYDRDSATERKQRGDDKLWQFMVRVRIPGGRLTAAQYLALDALADRYANGSLRITTRQSIQFHGVLKPGLKRTIAEINEALLTTLAACVDVVRTVTTVPAPIRDPVHRRLDADARRLSTHLLPKTGAYHEIWLDGEKVTPEGDAPDPLYGERYLPRKFKVGLAVPEDNSIDVLTNDLAIVALFAFIVLRGFSRMSQEGNLFVLLAATGLLVQFGLQAAINMASSLHLIPTKGMTLPFLSYGGSSMLALGLGMGMMLALTRRRLGGGEQ